MKKKSVAQGLAMTMVAFGVFFLTNESGHTQQDRARGRASFHCETDAGEPATIAKHPNRGDVTIIIWSSDYFEQSGWNPPARCEQVSRKFQQNQESRKLNYIVSGRFNGYPVLCASRQVYAEVVNCSDSAVLMTLRPGDNSQEFINKIAELNTDRSVSPIRHSADILQSVRGSNLKAIDVGVMLRYSAPTRYSAPPVSGDCLFGDC